jgi:hypothetical protein
MLYQILLVLIALALAFPVGYWIAKLCNDEIAYGRKWFKSIIIVNIVLALGFFGAYLFFSNNINFIAIAVTLLFFAIITFISLIKSYDKKFVRIDK